MTEERKTSIEIDGSENAKAAANDINETESSSSSNAANETYITVQANDDALLKVLELYERERAERAKFEKISTELKLFLTEQKIDYSARLSSIDD